MLLKATHLITEKLSHDLDPFKAKQCLESLIGLGKNMNIWIDAYLCANLCENHKSIVCVNKILLIKKLQSNYSDGQRNGQVGVYIFSINIDAILILT